MEGVQQQRQQKPGHAEQKQNLKDGMKIHFEATVTSDAAWHFYSQFKNTWSSITAMVVHLIDAGEVCLLLEGQSATDFGFVQKDWRCLTASFVALVSSTQERLVYV